MITEKYVDFDIFLIEFHTFLSVVGHFYFVERPESAYDPNGILTHGCIKYVFIKFLLFKIKKLLTHLYLIILNHQKLLNHHDLIVNL